MGDRSTGIQLTALETVVRDAERCFDVATWATAFPATLNPIPHKTMRSREHTAATLLREAEILMVELRTCLELASQCSEQRTAIGLPEGDLSPICASRLVVIHERLQTLRRALGELVDSLIEAAEVVVEHSRWANLLLEEARSAWDEYGTPPRRPVT